jgi:hypothetical protein
MAVAQRSMADLHGCVALGRWQLRSMASQWLRSTVMAAALLHLGQQQLHDRTALALSACIRSAATSAYTPDHLLLYHLYYAGGRRRRATAITYPPPPRTRICLACVRSSATSAASSPGLISSTAVTPCVTKTLIKLLKL